MDLNNGNDFWVKAIKKEITNIGITFEILDKDNSALVRCSKESGHLIFDVRMGFTRKSQWVLNGHLSADPVGSTYDGVVFRDSVCIELTYASLKDIDVLEEVLTNNMPKPRGMGFVMRSYVAADHAGDLITHRYRTGFLLYLNCAPVYWISKK